MQLTCVLSAALTCFLPQSDQFILAGTISELCVWLTRLRTCQQWQANFWEIRIFFWTYFFSADVALPLISSEIIKICQILSEEFEKISVLGRRPLRQGRGGRERQEKQLPVCQPGIQYWHWPGHNTILLRISHFTILTHTFSHRVVF